MDRLYQESNIDNKRLKYLVLKITSRELVELSEPCYYPELKKYYFELLRACDLTEKKVVEFVKQFYKGTPASTWNLQNDKQTNLYIFIMWYFLKKKDISSFTNMMILFMIRYYTNRMFTHIRYCNKDVFKYTLEHMNKTHLFSREKTIAGAIVYLSKEMIAHHQEDISESNPLKISIFIQKSRHRIAQSVRSFAEGYYRASQEGKGFKTIPEPKEGEEENRYQYQNVEKTIKIIDKVTKDITVYNAIDKAAIEEAKNITKINPVLAVEIAKTLNNTKYSDNIKIILDLFLKGVHEIPVICGDKYYQHMEALLGVRRTTAQIYFKQQVNVLLLLIMKDMTYKNIFEKQTSQGQFLITSFLGYYLTLILRHSIC